MLKSEIQVEIVLLYLEKYMTVVHLVFRNLQCIEATANVAL